MKIVSGILCRGPRPTCKDELEALKNAGIDLIINLQSGFHEAFHDDDYEKYAGTCGIKILKIPCSDLTPPTEAQVTEFLKAVDSSSRTYVHCLHGVDRTGFMCAAYRMQRQRYTMAEAMGEMFEHGFHKWPYLWWTWELTKYAKR